MNHIFSGLVQPSTPKHARSQMRAVSRADGIRALQPLAVQSKHGMVTRSHAAQTHLQHSHAAHTRGDFSASLQHAVRCIALMPNAGHAWKLLGAAQFRLGLLEKYGSAQSGVVLGGPVRPEGLLEEAVSSSHRAVVLLPDDIEALCNYGEMLRAIGQSAQALNCFDRAVLLQPNAAGAHAQRAQALCDAGRLKEALDASERALAIEPASVDALQASGQVLRAWGRFDEAAQRFTQGLALQPTHPTLHANLGFALLSLGQAAQALLSYRRAVALDPGSVLKQSNYLFALVHSESEPLACVLAAHVAYGLQVEAPWRSTWPQHRNDQQADRKLRIGFVSGDLRAHSVRFFIEPIFRQINPAEFECVAYYTHPVEDAHSAQLKNLVSRWVHCASLSDAAMAAQIAEDQIDILIDLSGHTAHNRLPVFARKPAPIQASWIGYPVTTGLSAIDYRITDPFRAPVGVESQFTEKLARLPSSGKFDPLRELPELSPLPALANGYVTFGSFQRPIKLNGSTLTRWAKLLAAVPQSQLLVGAMEADITIVDIKAHMVQCGIGADRLQFAAKTSMDGYLALHARVDILLDTLPYPGGTTTNFGLWMGVPTLTCTTQAALSWQSAAMMARVGLADWIADGDDAFVALGTAKAQDWAALSTLRQGMRARLRSSPLYDAAHITRYLERAMRMMWQRWCAGLPADHFEVSA